jgi:hypothetical protein
MRLYSHTRGLIVWEANVVTLDGGKRDNKFIWLIIAVLFGKGNCSLLFAGGLQNADSDPHGKIESSRSV